MKINIITLTAAVSLAMASPPAAHASSHMDAPLITRDPSANTTDVYAFVDQERQERRQRTEIPCRCPCRLSPRGTGSRAEYLQLRRRCALRDPRGDRT